MGTESENTSDTNAAPPLDLAAEVRRLCVMRPGQYALERKGSAKKLGIPPSFLDQEIKQAQQETRDAKKARAATKTNGHAVDHDVAASSIKTATKDFFTPLGEADQKFYFLSSRTQRIMSFISRDLRSGNAPRDLVPDEHFWAGVNGSDMSMPAWRRIGDALVDACYEAGYFSPARIRARGVWLDDNRVIAHIGHEVWVDGHATQPIAVPSKFIYPLQQTLIETEGTKPLTDAEGQAFVALCRKLAWANKLSGDLLAGLIATSHICGALKFRTHGWVTGPTHSGKTWVLQNIVMKALGTVAINIVGSSTEAGIRQEVSVDARPVVYDEAEGRGQVGKVRREFIIDLMRAASADSDGQVLKGGAGHKAQGFRIKTQFIMASIGVGITERADETRTLILTLRNLAETASKEDVEAHFSDVKAALSAFADDLPARMFQRMVALVPIVRKNAEKFRQVIASKYADSRTGDQIGTVLAGTAALTCGRELTDAEIDDRLQKFSWDAYVAPHDEKDESAILKLLASWPVQVETDKSRVTRTVAELCMIASGIRATENTIGHAVAKQTLERMGLKFDALPGPNEGVTVDGLWIANTHRELDKMLAGSAYPQGYGRIIGRVGGAKKSEKPVRFAGSQSRATWVPLYQLIGEDHAGEQGKLEV